MKKIIIGNRGEAAIAMALYRRPKVQSDLAEVMKNGFFLQMSFLLGPIRPRAMG
jgi:hypothetical protein